MIMHRPDPAVAIRSLRSAAPYIRMYKGKTFVVKAGGGVFADAQAVRGLIEQIAILHYFGVRVVFVHGGGPQLTEITEALGVPTRMVQGRRVTDQKAIDATSMVLNGLINTKLLALCREMNIDAVGVSGVDAGLVRAHKRAPVKIDTGETVDYGFVGDIDQVDPSVLNKLLALCREMNIDAVGVSGVDAGLVRAHKRAPVKIDTGETVDYGFVGDIDQVDPSVLNKLLDNGLMPIVSPVSADDTGTLLNINGDTVAAAIGAALDAEKLMLCTGAPGILADVNDPTSIISYTDLAGLKKLRDEKKIVDGMLPKAKAIEDAIRGGVRRVHVMSYKSGEGILAEVFTNEGAGTLIVADVNALTPAEQQSGK